MQRIAVVLCVIALALTLGQAASAENWTVFQADENEVSGEISAIIFTLDKNILSLNTPGLTERAGSSAENYELLFSGTWAACGTVDGSRNFVPDPYAKFVMDGYGGSVVWADGTPKGYSAPLMLGCSFKGDGAAEYQNALGYEPADKVKGTLVVWDSLPMFPGAREVYNPVDHTFKVVHSVPAPEPSGIAAVLVTAVTALAGGLGRIKRMRRA
jgi:hypothetical protein